MKELVKDPRRKVTVCDRCLQASCWRGDFYCQFYQTAGTVDLPVETLRELDLEHPSYWDACQTCQGDGVVELPGTGVPQITSQTCPDCDGSGRAEVLSPVV